MVYRLTNFGIEYSSNRNQYMSTQVGLIVGSAYLTFTYNAELGKYAEYIPTIEKILTSVKVNDSALTEIPRQNNTLVNNTIGISVEYHVIG